MMWSNKHIDPAYQWHPLWAEKGIGQNEFPCHFLHVPTKQNRIEVAVYSRNHARVVYSTDGLAADLPRHSDRQRHLSNCDGAAVGVSYRGNKSTSVASAEINNLPQRVRCAAVGHIAQVLFIKVHRLKEFGRRRE